MDTKIQLFRNRNDREGCPRANFMRTPADLRSLARAHTEVGIKILAGIAMNEEFPPAARVSAVAQLLDRGWGKAVQPVSSDPDGPLIVEIIQRVREPK